MNVAEATRAHRWAADLLRERLKPPSDLTVSEWADNHRILPSTSAEPGRWRTDRTPYLREIMDAFSDALVERVVFMKAAQLGGSEALLNVLGYFIDQDPSTILFVQPTDGDAGKFSKERIAPMIRESPVLAEKVSSPRARHSGNTIESKEFPGGHLGIVGANAPNKLRARPRRVVLFDEVDGYPHSVGHGKNEEGDPIELGVKRTSTYWNRKIGMISTPTVRGASRIENAHEESDQRYYLVPCPHCGYEQRLRWERIRWEKSGSGADTRHRPETAHYRCEDCDGRILERHKPKMLAAGRWEATNPDAMVVGFHLSALYSPWFTWVELVREFLAAKESPHKLRVFVNTRLAETYEDRGEAPEWRRIYDRREDYPLGTCPEGVVFLTAGVDVQRGGWIEADVWGWGYEKESWLIDTVVAEGNPRDPRTWQAITELLHRSFPGPGDQTFQISAMAVDTGWGQDAVVDWARRVADRRIMLVKGDHWKNWRTIVGTPSKSEVTIQGKKTGLLLWPVGGALVKQETYGYLELEAPLDGEPYPPGYIHIPMVDDEWVKGLVSEDLVTKTDTKGFAKREWVKNRRRNEPLDKRVYARAAAEREGLGRLIRSEAEREERRATKEPDPDTGSSRWLDRAKRRRGGKGWLGR